ncbi:MAG: hypothetical protein MI920_25965, partial [Kiloniellales bacterium]|nr:hypothetical protein [Kiloniellales bacterium]
MERQKAVKQGRLPEAFVSAPILVRRDRLGLEQAEPLEISKETKSESNRRVVRETGSLALDWQRCHFIELIGRVALVGNPLDEIESQAVLILKAVVGRPTIEVGKAVLVEGGLKEQGVEIAGRIFLQEGAAGSAQPIGAFV